MHIQVLKYASHIAEHQVTEASETMMQHRILDSWYIIKHSEKNDRPGLWHDAHAMH